MPQYYRILDNGQQPPSKAKKAAQRALPKGADRAERAMKQSSSKERARVARTKRELKQDVAGRKTLGKFKKMYSEYR